MDESRTEALINGSRLRHQSSSYFEVLFQFPLRCKGLFKSTSCREEWQKCHTCQTITLQFARSLKLSICLKHSQKTSPLSLACRKKVVYARIQSDGNTIRIEMGIIIKWKEIIMCKITLYNFTPTIDVLTSIQTIQKDWRLTALKINSVPSFFLSFLYSYSNNLKWF